MFCKKITFVLLKVDICSVKRSHLFVKKWHLFCKKKCICYIITLAIQCMIYMLTFGSVGLRSNIGPYMASVVNF